MKIGWAFELAGQTFLILAVCHWLDIKKRNHRTGSGSDNGSYNIEIKITDQSFDNKSERTDPEGMAEGKTVKSESELIESNAF